MMNRSKLLFVLAFGSMPALQLAGSCPAPAANLCSINANCISANTLVVTGPLIVTSTTPSPCNAALCNTGALVVAGGESVGGNLNVCGSVNTNTNYQQDCFVILVGDPVHSDLSVGINAQNPTGTFNTFVGTFAGGSAGDVSSNSAVGYRALENSQGANNSALGANALFQTQPVLTIMP